MDEQEKKKINEIKNKLARISGGLQGVISAAPTDKYTKDRIFEFSYSLQDIIVDLKKLREGK